MTASIARSTAFMAGAIRAPRMDAGSASAQAIRSGISFHDSIRSASGISSLLSRPSPLRSSRRNRLSSQAASGDRAVEGLPAFELVPDRPLVELAPVEAHALMQQATQAAAEMAGAAAGGSQPADAGAVPALTPLADQPPNQ